MSQHDPGPAGQTPVTEATREAEQREAVPPADPGGEPAAEKAAAAERNEVGPAVAAAKEAVERVPA